MGSSKGRLPSLSLAVFALLTATAGAAAAQTLLSNLEREIADIVTRAEPAIVTILADVSLDKKDAGKSSSLFSIFSSDRESADSGESATRYTHVGTGLYLNGAGYVATRASVVAGAKSVRVQTWLNEQSPAELIGVDNETGIAILRIDTPRLRELPNARPNTIGAGSWIMVIGNSMGVTPAVSMGNVNAVHDRGYIQIGAQVEPGASGAPVLNADGEVIGILYGRVAYQKQQAGPQSGNTALVVPMQVIYKSAERLVRDYEDRHGWIGISVKMGPYDDAKPLIVEIEPGSPAENAGLRPGDIVLGCNDVSFDDYYQLKQQVKDARPGDDLRFELLRGQKRLELNVAVGKCDHADLFKGVPYTEMVYEEPGSRGFLDEDARSRLLLERRLRQMEDELRDIRRRIYKKQNQ